MPHKKLLITAIIAGDILIAAYLFLIHWSPENASRRAQDSFIEAIATRDTKHLAKSISPTYADTWGMNQANVEEGFREILKGFISTAPEWTEESDTLENDTATFTGRLRLKGRALPFGQLVQSRLNSTKAPFTFTWQREGTPWTWKLTKLENEDLHIPKNIHHTLDL